MKTKAALDPTISVLGAIKRQKRHEKGPSPHRIRRDGKPAKREWIVAEQEGRGGGVSYHFTGKAAAVRRFERVLKTLEGGSVTAVELWDSRRVARVTVRVRYRKPQDCDCYKLKDSQGKLVLSVHRSACKWHERPLDEATHR